MAAEDYDACDALQQQLEELQAAHAVAQAIVPMTMAEASEITSSYTAESTRLQNDIDKNMEAEDYDACDALQAELDALKAKHETALKLTGSGVAVSSAVSEGVPPSTEAQAPATVEPTGMLGGFDFSAPAPAADAAPQPAGFALPDSTPDSTPMPSGDAAVATDAPAAEAFGIPEAQALLDKITELENELGVKMDAEDYERCEELNAEIEKLKEREDEAKQLTGFRDDE